MAGQFVNWSGQIERSTHLRYEIVEFLSRQTVAGCLKYLSLTSL